MRKSKTQLRWLWLSLSIIFLDQLTKIWAQNYWFESKTLLPILNFSFIKNTGAAFSFLSQAGGWQRWFFMLIALIISVLMIYQLVRLRARERWHAIPLALILGGALGNFYDRLVRGSVIDFIQLHYKDWYFPTFNIADIAITFGALIWLILSLSNSRLKT